MQQQEIIPHLFRTEYRKIVSVLYRRFGFEQMETAEDIASDTFATATQNWPVNGIPPNPVAWLYAVAKNKAKTALQRSNLFDSKISPHLQRESQIFEDEIDLSPQNINDSQLQMIFAICHPAIPAEAQVGLALRILCGFGIDEIADAFLSNKETIGKRLYRAKEKLRAENIKIEIPSATQIDARLENVLLTIYLLFNEGYYSLNNNAVVNKDICFEAIRLCSMLAESPNTNKPVVNALLALMYFHASRLDARVNRQGAHILYDEQDTDLWDSEMISTGAMYLHRAANGNNLSKYHLEAMIAWWRTQKTDTIEKWEAVLGLYNKLLMVAYSPVAALNRAYVLSKTAGKAHAIAEAEKLNMQNNLFYQMLMAYLYTDIDTKQALFSYQQALKIAKTDADKTLINNNINYLLSKV
ncbi:RNA polymerase sigma factor [Mucilaginibacter calamicampi]|uniref:RNA polymerase sigma factor n=1 Tax=Mucilaginibacter calamicampi TaxID=1302352 RepID=A0ABW2Z018_9SPHI